MNRHHRSFTAVMFAGLAAIILLFAAGTAHAQFPPACGPNLTIKNGTACNLNFCLKGLNGVFCWPVPATSSIVVPYPPGFVAGGVINTGNNTTYPFVPSFNPTAPWWVPNIRISGCCVDVLYDPALCVMWVVNTSSPPPCQ